MRESIGEGLTENQRKYMRRARTLEADDTSFMPDGVGQRASVAALVRLGLMVKDEYESMHEDTGRIGWGYRLTDAGRAAVSP